MFKHLCSEQTVPKWRVLTKSFIVYNIPVMLSILSLFFIVFYSLNIFSFPFTALISEWDLEISLQLSKKALLNILLICHAVKLTTPMSKCLKFKYQKSTLNNVDIKIVFFEQQNVIQEKKCLLGMTSKMNFDYNS